MKKAAGPNGPTAKKKPPAQRRKADEIYLKLQKNAPFPTRQCLYVLWFSHYRKITFLGKTMSNPPHPSTKPTSMAIQLKTGNERRVSGFEFCNWKPGIRNSEPSLHTAISPKTAAYPLKISIAANRDCPHRIQVPDSADTYRLPATWAADEANLEIRIS